MVDSPRVSLAEDSGLSDSDGITNNGLILLSGLEDGASWFYRLDSTSDWLLGIGDSVSVTRDGDNKIEFRQVDLAGNE
jgi:hypothetical protein